MSTTKAEEDVEAGIEATEVKNEDQDMVTMVSSLDEGGTIEEKIGSFVSSHDVAMISKTWCPFSRDAKDFLGSQIGVKVFSLEVDKIPDGSKVLASAKNTYNHSTVPMIFIKVSY